MMMIMIIKDLLFPLGGPFGRGSVLGWGEREACPVLPVGLSFSISNPLYKNNEIQ